MSPKSDLPDGEREILPVVLICRSWRAVGGVRVRSACRMGERFETHHGHCDEVVRVGECVKFINERRWRVSVFGAHNGLRSDIAPCPPSANNGHHSARSAAEIEDDFALLIADIASRILMQEIDVVVVLPKVLQ